MTLQELHNVIPNNQIITVRKAGYINNDGLVYNGYNESLPKCLYKYVVAYVYSVDNFVMYIIIY